MHSFANSSTVKRFVSLSHLSMYTQGALTLYCSNLVSYTSAALCLNPNKYIGSFSTCLTHAIFNVLERKQSSLGKDARHSDMLCWFTGIVPINGKTVQVLTHGSTSYSTKNSDRFSMCRKFNNTWKGQTEYLLRHNSSSQILRTNIRTYILVSSCAEIVKQIILRR